MSDKPIELADGGQSGGKTILFDLDFEEAQRLKWEHGRREYGDAWAGMHPLLEAHDETIDIANYCDEAGRRGIDCADLKEIVRLLREEIRERARDHGIA